MCYVYVCMCVCVYMCMYVYVCVCMCMCLYVYVYIQKYTYMYTYLISCIRIWFIRGPFLTKTVDFGSIFGSIWGRFGIDLGSVWDQFRIDLGSVRDRFGVDLVDLGGISGICRNLVRKGIVRKVAPYMDGKNASICNRRIARNQLPPQNQLQKQCLNSQRAAGQGEAKAQQNPQPQEPPYGRPGGVCRAPWWVLECAFA